MAGKRSLTENHISSLLAKASLEDLEKGLSPKDTSLLSAFLPTASTSSRGVEKMWQRLISKGFTNEPHPHLWDSWTKENINRFNGNIENCIGSLKLPLGIAGPLQVNGLFAQGAYPIPLATSEAALVASYHRGCSAITASGGCTAMLIYQALNRAPAFLFTSMSDAAKFVVWITENFEQLQQQAQLTTSHGSLVDFSTTLEGNHVYLNFEYTTGDASGQNMVTIATQSICEFIQENSPVTIQKYYVEGNMSGDKKASSQAYNSVRGKKVSAEVNLSPEILEKYLHTTATDLEQYWRVSAIGGVLSGTMGVQGHFANGLAALYLATGQDPACVAESAMGVTRFEAKEDGSLYAAVTLPSIMVGTVGGGTTLPAQKASLELMNLAGPGHSEALAEVVGGLLLAGELSIIAALSTHTFTKSHHKLARK